MAAGSLMLLFGPRKWVLAVFLTISLFVSFGPKVVVFDQNFMVYRVLLLFAWSRILTRGEFRGLTATPLDWAFVHFNIWTIIGDTLLFGTTQAFVYQVANCLYDRFGIYFLVRIFVRDSEDFLKLLRTLAGLTVALAVCMVAEFLTGRTFLDALGAFNETVQVRMGRMRCQGAFGVPITAGTFGAVMLPLLLVCRWQEQDLKKWVVPGIIAATLITLTAGSGGPVLTYVAALGGLALWRFREKLKAIRWGALFGLLALSLVMNAPVWFIIARLQVVPGASAYHRAKIVDVFVKNFNEWWLLGVQSTAEWGWEMVDVANQYCVVAKHGGLLAVILFVRMLVVAFRQVGMVRRKVAGDLRAETLVWGVGAMLFAHCVAFIGISYFDQMKIFWAVSLAMVASLPLLAESQVFETEYQLEKFGTKSNKWQNLDAFSDEVIPTGHRI